MPMKAASSGNVAESPISCIFFSEFDPKVGPKITFQFPENYVQKEAFDLLKVYLIPKEELQHKLITLNMCSMKILGFPAGIKDDKCVRPTLRK